MGNSYYIAVSKKNSTETWSESITIDEPTLTHELTANIYTGDLNRDGIVDLTDLALLYNDRVTSANPDKDGKKEENEIFDFEKTVYDNAFNFVTTNKPDGAQLSPMMDDSVNVSGKFRLSENCAENIKNNSGVKSLR
ncbi:MAG: hypothetical protein IPL53_24225 [Ignavibacteria bacterium]|nr:hypothetical protein [Ignavibacteria bacterium]